jgi:hypothetical protein
VFFLTSAKLSPQDPDDAFDVYDARVCDAPGAEEGCPPAASTPQPPCESEGGCKGAAVPTPTFGAPASSALSGSGNLPQQGGVLSEKENVKPKPKPLTRAQKLAAALKLCKKDKRRSKRVACERQARRRYGPTKRAKKSSEKATKSSAKSKSTGAASSRPGVGGRS